MPDHNVLKLPDRPAADAAPVIDTDLVARLVAEQFPQWSDLPIKPVEVDGWDNRTFRLGEELSVRLPSAAGYAPQVAKEQRWLPYLAARLATPIPEPLAQGRPGQGYPFPWSVYRWLDGVPADRAGVDNLPDFPVEVARFLVALQAVDPAGGPPPGLHSAFRGGPLSHYAEETWAAIDHLDQATAERAAAVWDAATSSVWDAPPVWFHGDVAEGNLLVRDGHLVAVIDFGCAGVGDPACDLVIAWTTFGGKARAAFRAAVGADPATWARGRGWALWKALITSDHRVIEEVLSPSDPKPGSRRDLSGSAGRLQRQ